MQIVTTHVHHRQAQRNPALPSQSVEAAAVRGRVVPRLRRPTRRHFSARAGEAVDSADAAKTSGSWTNRPNLATQCFGCRADKRKYVQVAVTSGTRERAKRSASAVLVVCTVSALLLFRGCGASVGNCDYHSVQMKNKKSILFFWNFIRQNTDTNRDGAEFVTHSEIEISPLFGEQWPDHYTVRTC